MEHVFLNKKLEGERLTEITSRNVLELWVKQFSEVYEQWLPHLQNKKQNAFDLYRYCEWAKLSPTGLLALKENPANLEAERLLNRFVAVDERNELINSPFTKTVTFRITTAVRSFFKWNMKDLARIAGKLEIRKEKEIKKPTKEGLYKLWRTANNPRDRSIITLANSSSIAKETITNLRWGHLEDGWENRDVPHISIESELIKGHGRGRYRGVRQETFITPEAKRDLLDWKEWCEKKMGRALTKEDEIYRETYFPYDPLKYRRLGNIIWELEQNTGVDFSLHDARRYVQTALEEAGIVESWARKIRGRKVAGSVAPYSQPEIEKLREAYRRALPYLMFIEKPPVLMSLEEQKQEAIRILAAAGIDYKALLRSRKVKTTEEEVKVLQEKIGVMLKREKETKTATNGGFADCQRIVTEQELPALLAEGWRVAAVLPSGKVVVSNNN